MANKTIPFEDKAIVLQRLAEGASTRQAIQDTSIQSNSTAALIAKRESNAIARHRRTYLMLMDKSIDICLEDRAKLWGTMAWAYKYDITGYYTKTNPVSGAVTKVPIVDNVPDWRTRERALRYIDWMQESIITDTADTEDSKNIQVNLINNSSDFQINN